LNHAPLLNLQGRLEKPVKLAAWEVRSVIAALV